MGRLWTSLADYFIRRGMFERARDVYEEGLTSVVTVRDFSLVYDALTQVRRLCFVVAGLRAPVHLALALALASDAFSPGTTPTPRCILIQPQPHPTPQFEESLISAKMEQAADEDEEAPALEDEDGEDFLLKDAGDDLDLR